MQTTLKVAVLGAGSWGTAVANTFADAGAEVRIWGRDPGIIEALRDRKENPKYLPGMKLSSRLDASTDFDATVAWADMVVCSIPTQQIRKVFTGKGKLLAGKTFVNTSKGIEIGSFARVSEIMAAVAPGAKYVILSGPSFAEEVVRRLPTAVTVASVDAESVQRVQAALSTPYLRAYRASDVVGVELAGALKNVIAISSGIVAGLKLGYNAQAAIINRGIAEMARLGKRLGAEPLTFLGLAGMGDLILTCTGPLSRNRRLGIALAEGKSLEEARQLLGGVAEGAYTAQAVREFIKSRGIDMPITEQVYRILYEGSTPQQALTELMSRDLKAEWGDMV